MKSLALRLCGIVGVVACALAGQALAPLRQPLRAQGPSWDNLSSDYTTEIRPLLLNYCKGCHGGKRQEADLDLEAFANLADVRKASRAWQKVLEMLETEQMPPRKAKQPTANELTKLRTWARSYLKAEARSRAGDPGRVVLRRLSNAEYTYTIRDLTGVEALNPAREFPVDGAAGEGFTNTGDALVMSPALFTKYLAAAKSIATHAVLLPDGLRFSPHTTRRDWTNEVLEQIRTLYGTYSDSSDSTKVNLQGLIWDAKQGGRLPVEKYLAATLAERDALATGRKTLAAVASERGLSAEYLALLWDSLNAREPSLLLDEVRARWRQAKPEDAAGLAVQISHWQKALWTFNSVGHIGKLDGPKAWMEPAMPLVAKHPLRYKVPAAGGDELRFYLIATDVGDGSEHDYVVWQEPKFVASSRPDLLLRDVRRASRELSALRGELFADAGKYLRAVDEAAGAAGMADVAALSKKHALDTVRLRVWLDLLGIGGTGPVVVQGHFTNKITATAGYPFIQGWGDLQTPNLVANSSDQHVRIPGNMKPHGVAVHPAPKRNAVVGWQSPIAGKMRVTAKVAHAHPECGDGVAWALEHSRGGVQQTLGAGVAQGAKEPRIEPLDIMVKEGDLIALVIGPRANHSCDLTAVDLTLSSSGQTWDLAKDVSSDVLTGNPHADRLGNKAVWHFYTEPTHGANDARFAIPKGSLLDRWRSAATKDKAGLAAAVQALLTSGPTAATSKADADLYRQLAGLNGPLLGRLWELRSPTRGSERPDSPSPLSAPGLDPALFGRHPAGAGKVDASSLCVQAPSVVEVCVPADLVAGYDLVTTGVIHADSQDQGSVQLQVLPSRPAVLPARQPGIPILVADGGASRKRLVAALETFRNLFPPSVSYTKIVPVDEVVTLTLFYREDHHLARLMLDDEQRQKLDRLWDELDYISQAALSQVDAFAQLMEYATQDSNPKLFEPLRKPIHDRAAALHKRLVATQPKHVEAVFEFASRAYRRPLAQKEKDDLTALYHKLRKQALPHEEAVRLTIARVLVAPAFLYRLEQPGPGVAQTPVSDWELASRLSYFLWSSAPDAELTATAASGKLHDLLVPQMKRMLKDGRVRRLATEFGCQWLHIRGFDELNEKSERHFPTFAGLRAAMYEESILFFTDLFARDRSLLEILDADYTFVNDSLAQHYGIPGISGSHWRRIDGVKKFGRGGILGQATTLATQSGASRTSPILRGNWVSEVLLGEKLPRPPKGVPQLPDDETKTEGFTVRQLIEKHSSDPKCAVCHRRIDAYGFALEGFDAIGRSRAKDLGDRPIHTHARTMDGAEFEGIGGLRDYLLSKRRDAFVRQFCRKLLGYALARGVQLSDEPLLDEIHEQLKANDYRITVAIAAIVRSPQFREIRGSKFPTEE